MKQVQQKRMSVFQIIAAAGFLIALILMGTPPFSAAFLQYSGGLEKLDMRLNYGAGDVYTLFQTLGVDGRAVYIRYLCLDFFFILCFYVVQDSLLRMAMGSGMQKSRWRLLRTLPLVRGSFDLAENSLILFLLLRYPVQMPPTANMLGTITFIKFFVLGLWLAAIPLCAVVRMRTKRKHAKQTVV